MDLNQYLQDLEYLVNTDSCSDDPDGLNKVSDFFCEKFNELNWITEKHNFAPESGTLLICKNREAEHYDLMLVGHLDTVFPKGTCAQRPFSIKDGIAYGPGVADMKSGTLLIYYLMKELPKEINEKLNIVAVLNPDEEIGSVYSFPVYSKYAKITDYAFVYEGGGKNGAKCIERKGAVGLRIDFTGKPGHCGYVFSNGAKSAISEMARWIVGLDSLQNREKNTTVNVGVASGGTKVNVVAEHASISVGIRFIDKSEIVLIEEKIEELTKNAGRNEIQVNIVRSTYKPPMVLTDKSRAYIERVKALDRANGKEREFNLRGGLSDANLISEFGVVCIDGMGPEGSLAHSPDEYLKIGTVADSFNFSNMLIKDLFENKK